MEEAEENEDEETPRKGGEKCHFKIVKKKPNEANISDIGDSSVKIGSSVCWSVANAFFQRQNAN